MDIDSSDDPSSRDPPLNPPSGFTLDILDEPVLLSHEQEGEEEVGSSYPRSEKRSFDTIPDDWLPTHQSSLSPEDGDRERVLQSKDYQLLTS